VEYSSKLIEQAVSHFSNLPGVGKKSALRYVLHLIKKDTEDVENLASILRSLKSDLKYCKQCHTISDYDVCEICSSDHRQKNIVCVVQDYRDVLAIENTGLFKGSYHVLGGLISPMEGIGPSNLTVDSLVNKVREGLITEVILALNANMEGETTSFYIFKKLAEFDVTLSVIARGISVGDELEYADEVTLGRSIINRIPFSNSLVK
jgi:recombination protein RecR